MDSILVACFSPTGATAAIGRLIASLMEAPFFEIAAKPPYTGRDLDWNDDKSRSSLEMRDASARPAIADRVENMAGFSSVFLGFPIWWYKPPRIIQTFLESYSFSGKTMIPFVTSGSSGLGKIPDHLKQMCPDAHWLPGRRFAPGTGESEVSQWLKTIKF